MIKKEEIVITLKSENNKYFHIEDLSLYAQKIIDLGKAKVLRDENGKLMSYILFYDNNPEIFISMVWTNPIIRGKGIAKKLMIEFIKSTDKDILLEVNKENPAKYLYRKLNFKKLKEVNGNILMKLRKSISIMQPYIFPYIGYFHLIEASELFVFYDDVNYIKRGWINRNRILHNGKDFLFTVPLKKVSQNKLINEIEPIIDEKWKKSFFSNLEFAYKKAPYYKDVIGVIKNIFDMHYSDITDLCINSIKGVYSYLGKELNYVKSSQFAPETKGLEKANRLIEITKKAGYSKYTNAIGGQSLYDKEYFKEKGIELYFVKSNLQDYKQFKNEFIKGLSIIDVLMFNDKNTIIKYLNDYELM